MCDFSNLKSEIKKNRIKSKQIVKNQNESYKNKRNHTSSHQIVLFQPGLIARSPFCHGRNGRSDVERGSLRVFGKTRFGQVEIRSNSAVPDRNGRVLNPWRYEKVALIRQSRSISQRLRHENAVRQTPKPFECGRFVMIRPHVESRDLATLLKLFQSQLQIQL